MKQESYTTTVLRAEEGHVLTEAVDVDITARTLATAISLGRGDSPDNYREITAAEADALRAEQIAAFDRLAAERRARIEAAANNPDMQP